MADKINGVSGTLPQAPARQSSAGEKAAAGSDESRAARAEGDSVNLTDSARRLNSLTEQAAAGEAVDAGRVEAVRNAIESGDYQVDANRVADRLVAFERLLED
jgi:negative regulator of flagellin synthesis FlgM